MFSGHLRIYVLLSSAFLLILVMGCSGINRSNQLLTPDIPQEVTSAVSETTHSIYGVYEISVDVSSQNIQINPARNSELDLHVNLNPYLVSYPCADCLRLQAVSLDSDNNLLMDFALRHAFQNAATRPDLNGFDLRGILVLPASKIYYLTPKVKAVFDPVTHQMIRDQQFVVANPGVVKNADGYTALWDYYTDLNPNFTNLPGTVNPFMNYFWEDDPDPEVVGNPIPWRTFYVGGGWDVKRYVLDTSKLDQTFQCYFIADVTYGKAATWQTRQHPFYRNPQFNIKEAYDVTVNLDNSLVSGDVTSVCNLEIRVKDWQAGAPIVQDPQNPGQDEIDSLSDVKQITIEAPDFQTGLITLTSPTSGSGSDADPYIYNTTIRNLEGKTTGKYFILIAVEDTLNQNDLLDLRTFKVVELEVRSSQTVIEFNAPERVTNNEHASFLWPKESIALDSNNNPHVVWTDDRSGYHQVYYSYRNSSGVWSQAEDISQSAGQAYYATVAVDSQNRGHIVWEDTAGNIDGMNIHYGLKTGAGLAHNIDITQFDDGIKGCFPRIVTDDGDEPHIVWEDNKNSNNDTDYDVHYMQIDLSGPSPVPDYEQYVGKTSAYEGQPMVAINPSNEPRIIMVRKDTVHTVYYAKYVAGSFSDPASVASGPSLWPDIEFANSGACVVAFHGGAGANTLIYATYSLNDGVSWATLIQISETSALNQVIPDVEIDSFGIAHILWHEADPDTQIPGYVKYRQYSGGQLSAEQAITPDGYPSAFPSVVVDNNDQLHVVLQTFVDDNYEIFYITSRD
jgi:hypothetical protein